MLKLIDRTSFALAALVLALPATAQQYQTLDEIVAIVDENVILRSELDSTIENVLGQFQARGDRIPPRQVLEEQVLERLIMNQVQVQRAEMTGVRISDQEIDNTLSNVARQNGMSLIQLRQALEGEGMDFNEFREDVRHQLLVSRLNQRIVESMDQVTQTEIEILLASGALESDDFHLSQIALLVPQGATPAQIREVQRRIASIRERLDEGMSFAEAAANFSESPDALEGGEIGWRNLNTMPRQIADAIRDMQPGEVSPPLVTEGAAVLIRVNDRRPRGEVIVDEFRVRHLLVEPSELVSPEAAQRLIEDLHQRIQQGEDFEELARQYSDDERSSNLGGLMDWFPEGAFGQTIQAVCNSLDPGELSQPFQTNQGWHLLKLEGKRESDMTEEALRAEAHEMIVQQRADEEIERTLRQMRDEAYVEILL